MNEYKTGTICSVRGSTDDWQVIGNRHDGLVMKYVMQSRNTGEIRCMFNFEVFEKNSATYKEINDFFKATTGIGLDENLDFLDDDLNENETVNTVVSPLVTDSASPVQPLKRFKSISDTDINRLKAQNTERTTDNSTKWAVGLLKGIEI